MSQDCDVTEKPIMVQNLQADATAERAHQTIMGNVLCTFDIPSTETVQDQIPGVLAAVACRICSAMHTTV